jgi:hypothetical protein
MFMKELRQIAVGLALLLAIGAPVVAHATAPQAGGARQGRGQGGRGGAVSAATLPIGTLDYMLTLKDDQKTKITDAQTALKAAVKDAAGDRTKITEANAKATADIDAVLTDDQKAKLKEHLPVLRLLQQSRAFPLAVLPDLKLTADQRSKIMDAAKDPTEKLAVRPRPDQATRQTILAEFKTKVESILTDDQKKTIADKTPKPGANANP